MSMAGWTTFTKCQCNRIAMSRAVGEASSPIRAAELLVLYVTSNNSYIPHGWRTLGIQCKDVLSIGVDRMLVGNRVGLGLTWSNIRPLLPFVFPVRGARKLTSAW